jgi:hypothetical protein
MLMKLSDEEKHVLYNQKEMSAMWSAGPGAVRSSDEEYSVEIADRLVSSSRYDRFNKQ